VARGGPQKPPTRRTTHTPNHPRSTRRCSRGARHRRLREPPRPCRVTTLWRDTKMGAAADPFHEKRSQAQSYKAKRPGPREQKDLGPEKNDRGRLEKRDSGLRGNEATLRVRQSGRACEKHVKTPTGGGTTTHQNVRPAPLCGQPLLRSKSMTYAHLMPFPSCMEGLGARPAGPRISIPPAKHWPAATPPLRRRSPDLTPTPLPGVEPVRHKNARPIQKSASPFEIFVRLRQGCAIPSTGGTWAFGVAAVCRPHSPRQRHRHGASSRGLASRR
jgi:hypothetical protein